MAHDPTLPNIAPTAEEAAEDVIPAAQAELEHELRQHSPGYYSLLEGGEVVHDPPRELSPQEEMERQADARCFPNAARRREQEAGMRRGANVPTAIRCAFDTQGWGGWTGRR